MQRQIKLIDIRNANKARDIISLHEHEQKRAIRQAELKSQQVIFANKTAELTANLEKSAKLEEEKSNPKLSQ